MAVDDSFPLPGPMYLKARVTILAFALGRVSLPCGTCFVHVASSTLFSLVSRHPRRDTVQLNLAFLEIPNPSAIVLESLDEAQRAATLEVLARLVAQAAQNHPSAQGADDD